MKILCLLVILANIFVLMWEYRNGAFTDRKTSQEQLSFYGNEKIILLSEQKKEPQPPLPKQIQDVQSDALKPSAGDNMPHNTTKQVERSQVQLP